MAALHGLLAQLSLVLVLLSAGWAAVLVVRSAPGGRYFVVNLGWTVGAIALAAVLGLVLLVTGPGPADPLHLVYGALALVALPGAALLAAGRPVRRQAIVVCIGAVVLLILVVRLFQTG